MCVCWVRYITNQTGLDCAVRRDCQQRGFALSLHVLMLPFCNLTPPSLSVCGPDGMTVAVVRPVLRLKLFVGRKAFGRGIEQCSFFSSGEGKVYWVSWIKALQVFSCEDLQLHLMLYLLTRDKRPAKSNRQPDPDILITISTSSPSTSNTLTLNSHTKRNGYRKKERGNTFVSLIVDTP